MSDTSVKLVLIGAPLAVVFLIFLIVRIITNLTHKPYHELNKEKNEATVHIYTAGKGTGSYHEYKYRLEDGRWKACIKWDDVKRWIYVPLLAGIVMSIILLVNHTATPLMCLQMTAVLVAVMLILWLMDRLFARLYVMRHLDGEEGKYD